MTLIRAALKQEPPSNKSRTYEPLDFIKSRTQIRAQEFCQIRQNDIK